jgi:hypothetical protein
MDTSSIKNKVLEELIAAMDERGVSDLKSKSPKFAKIETNDPAIAEALTSEDSQEDPTKEMTPMDFKEDKSEGESPVNESDDLNRLMELYSKLK